MTYFLLLGENADHGAELQSLLQSAGYQVEQVAEAASCWRQLQLGGRAAAGPKGVIIFTGAYQAGASPAEIGLPGLQSTVLSLARQMAHGWRLNLRQRCLQGPNGLRAGLTTLEYMFIKIFSMAEVGQAVSRKQIVKEFGEDYLSYDQNRIDTLVRRLRKKVYGEVGLKLPLSTVRVRGFAFDDVLSIDVF